MNSGVGVEPFVISRNAGLSVRLDMTFGTTGDHGGHQ
jgi:hypothetical protein